MSSYKFSALIDPHKQSPLFFKWSFASLFFLFIACSLCYVFRTSPIIKTTLDNIFVYFPNYLTHEMLGHNLTFAFLRFFQTGTCTSSYKECFPILNWIGTIAGNGVECLIPVLLILGSLHLRGGKWLLPPLFYWLATAWYGAAIYVSDARACTLKLTSSDMISSAAAGTKGDWYYVLEPLGLLNQDIFIGKIFYLLASIFLVLAIYSAWYYWHHSADSTLTSSSKDFSLEDVQITAKDYEEDPFAELLAQRDRENKNF